MNTVPQSNPNPAIRKAISVVNCQPESSGSAHGSKKVNNRATRYGSLKARMNSKVIERMHQIKSLDRDTFAKNNIPIAVTVNTTELPKSGSRSKRKDTNMIIMNGLIKPLKLFATLYSCLII